MILEMVVWGFFSAWGWIGANYMKEQIWPEEKPAVVQSEKKEEVKKTNKEN